MSRTRGAGSFPPAYGLVRRNDAGDSGNALSRSGGDTSSQQPYQTCRATPSAGKLRSQPIGGIPVLGARRSGAKLVTRTPATGPCRHGTWKWLALSPAGIRMVHPKSGSTKRVAWSWATEPGGPNAPTRPSEPATTATASAAAALVEAVACTTRRRRARRATSSKLTFRALGAAAWCSSSLSRSSTRVTADLLLLLLLEYSTQLRAATQPRQRLRRLALHGADRAAEDLRGLRFGQVVEEPQDHHRPLPAGAASAAPH